MSSHSDTDSDYDSDEPSQLDLDLNELRASASACLNTECISAERWTGGTSHEIFILEFEPKEGVVDTLVQAGFSCIARFARVSLPGNELRDNSEIATCRYVKSHTNIPVPEIYHVDLDPDNDVGAPYVLMEKMPGKDLYNMWDDLAIDHKKAVLTQITSVIVQLASLKFDKIGCLNEAGVSPLVSSSSDLPSGPFDSVYAYLTSFISTVHVRSVELVELYQQIQKEVAGFLALNKQATYLQPSFSMIHADFDGQNMLFEEQTGGSPPRLSGIIDWEYSYTGPLYFLYEYPTFIQDFDWYEER
ncbi:hypothetical protein G7Z17_g3435 [Cylindrodendrum hubeiense]|uniref:Aminoglycoside phosphotransferase domain-containing protein n=1 Tax=Cylindrodendrum hubeiense TaxID=595255 RepID=A0A9P5HFV2_9HYPO|nr:hypothetical protein G7Z17_g3435 [Cylindrodendrum hubeiense]